MKKNLTLILCLFFMITLPRQANHHPKHIRSGSLLIEVTVALGLLTAIGLLLLKGSIDVMAPRNWIIVQNMADSYLSYEEAYARRVSFDEVTDDTNSDWDVFDPDTPVAPTNGIAVEIGKIPGGTAISGTLTRIRIADTTNIPTATSADYASNLQVNPAKMETWKLQSILTYSIGGKDYVKTRTVVRTR